MKALLLSILLLIIAGVTISCDTKKIPISRQIPQNNETYRVDYLFEYEGCKVYRFYDNGNYVYFTNCAGSVTSISNDSSKVRVQNIIRKDDLIAK